MPSNNKENSGNKGTKIEKGSTSVAPTSIPKPAPPPKQPSKTK